MLVVWLQIKTKRISIHLRSAHPKYKGKKSRKLALYKIYRQKAKVHPRCSGVQNLLNLTIKLLPTWARQVNSNVIMYMFLSLYILLSVIRSIVD